MRVRCVRLSRENHTTAGHNGGGTMRTADAGRIVACCVVVCVLAASCSCFRVRTTLAAGAAEPFAGGESPGDNDHRREPAADPVAPHCNDIDGDRRPRWFLGIDWRRAGSGMADHWWIVAVSSLLSLAVLWRIQCNVRKKLQQWKRLPLQKDQRAAYNCSRRLTLPDLTLAKHARRESLAEASLKSSNHPRKMSQCNGSSQTRNVKHNLFERNDDALAEMKRAHKIRRRH